MIKTIIYFLSSTVRTIFSPGKENKLLFQQLAWNSTKGREQLVLLYILLMLFFFFSVLLSNSPRNSLTPQSESNIDNPLNIPVDFGEWRKKDGAHVK